MKNSEFLSENDPDLQMFEARIGSKLYSFSKLRDGDKPSYAHPEFCEQSLNFDILPGNDSPLCPIALGIMSEDDYYYYELECFVYLENNYKYGQKKLNLILDKFEEQLNNEKLTLINQALRDVWRRIFKIFSDNIYYFLKHGKEAVYSILLNTIIVESKEITEILMEIAKSSELNCDLLKTVKTEAKYALLVLHTVQLSRQILDSHTETMGLNSTESVQYFGLNIAPRAIVLYILTIKIKSLHKELGARSRKNAIKSPADFMYVELSGGHKASEVKRYFRWLFIKAWIFSYLSSQEKEINLPTIAKVIAEDDRFYYLDNMQLAESFKDDNYRSEFKLERANTILNEFAKWNGYQGDDGYISGKILEKESRRKSYE